jgi:hypothetical protein
LPEEESESIEKLLSYVDSYWIGKIGPEKFSVYGDRHRTNNAVESFHRSLNRKCIGKHLDFWKFVGNLSPVVNLYTRSNLFSLYISIAELQKLEEITTRDFKAVSEKGMEIRKRPSKRDNEFNAQLENTISMLDRGLLSIKEFLVTISCKMHDSFENEQCASEVEGK